MASDVPDLNRVRSAHLIGIGGAAMTPLATILLQQGARVTGSDLVDATHLQVLRDLGARIWIGHDGARVEDPDVVIASSAVPDDNPEVSVAGARGIPVIKHAAALGALMRVRRGIAIAGTHGKSTTTALVAHLLETAGLAPTFHVGAELINYGLFGRLGQGAYLVAEADEFDRRFLEYDPHIAVVTCVEPDHLDYFGSFEALVEAYQDFVVRVRPGGLVVLNGDDPVAASLPTQGRQRLTYGAGGGLHWQVVAWEPSGFAGSRIALRSPHGDTYHFELGILGEHNGLNAAAAVAVASSIGIPLDVVGEGLKSFRGVRRRMEVIGTAGGVTLIDDYAHHPTEVRASLNAIRAHWHISSPNARRERGPVRAVGAADFGLRSIAQSAERTGGQPGIWVIYQPHTDHRTASLFAEFTRCFDAAEHVIITPAYLPPGRTLATEGATGGQLAEAIDQTDVRCLTPERAAAAVASEVHPGDIVVVMGAGDIWTIESGLMRALRGRQGSGARGRGGATGPRPPATGPQLLAPSPRPPNPGPQPLGLRRELADQLAGRARIDEPLWRHTSYRIGGPADIFLLATSAHQMVDAVRAAAELRVPWRIIGAASNLLVADEGVEGLVIKSMTRGVRYAPSGGTGQVLIHAEAGCLIASVAKRAALAGLTGLEWAATVPGTVAASVVNNSGAFGSCIAEHLVEASLYFPGTGMRTVSHLELGFDYRTSRLKTGEWSALVVEVTLQATRGDPAGARRKLGELDARRRASQPLGPSVGSVFRNPPGGLAGALIEAAGLKGMHSGDAEISSVHANFILNRRSAQAHDVVDLIRRAQSAVWWQHGVWLVPEIEFVGRWRPDELAPLTSPPS